MPETPETIDAIVRELREDARHVEDEIHNDDFWSNDEAAVIYRDLADRIEAAAERERAEWRRQLRNEIQINDTLATVRPQLHCVDDILAEAAKERAHEVELAKLRAPGNAAAMREALIAFVDSIQWLCDGDERGIFKKQFAPLLSEARAALAAPARNCDRYATYAEAVEAYREWTRRTTGDVSNVSGRGMLGWLFAPAEGGDNA